MPLRAALPLPLCRRRRAAEDIAAAAEKLTAAGAARILLAGGADGEPPTGVAEVVTKDMDALAFQTRTLDELTGAGAQ